jgi:hypothetical protein
LSDARKQVTLDGGMTGLLKFAGVHAESVEILADFQYTTVSDYLSHLGTYSSKAGGRIHGVSVRSHQDERHLNEHTDIQQTQGSSLHKDHLNLFRSSTRTTYEVLANDHGTLVPFQLILLNNVEVKLLLE